LFFRAPAALAQPVTISSGIGLPQQEACYAIIAAMKATIDAAGRIVVPEPLRLALGLNPKSVATGWSRLPAPACPG
jgi:hypothetical protein